MNLRADIDWSAWWQILRAANVFTAVTNVVAGFLLVQSQWRPLGPLLLLMLASALLYEAGMVLNDVCDGELDANERPERPIPSGRISLVAAKVVGITLLVAGVAVGVAVTLMTSQWQTAQISLALAATIVGYNVGAKATRFGPLAMAGCRMLNVLLGASIAGTLTTDSTAVWLFAWAVSFHTYGLTRIARQEVDSIDDSDLWMGGASVILGPLWIAALRYTLEDPQVSNTAWIAICMALLGSEVYLAFQLVNSPNQTSVRHSVSVLIRRFILIDAAVSALAAGWLAGLVVLSLYIPTWFLGRRVAMT